MQHDAVLCVHSILCLLEDEGVGCFHDLVRAFCSALCWKAVQKFGLLACVAHQLASDLHPDDLLH